jgi:hypothetical protein
MNFDARRGVVDRCDSYWPKAAEAFAYLATSHTVEVDA